MFNIAAISEGMSLPVIGLIAISSLGWLYRIDKSLAVMQVRMQVMMDQIEEIRSQPARAGRPHSKLAGGD